VAGEYNAQSDRGDGDVHEQHDAHVPLQPPLLSPPPIDRCTFELISTSDEQTQWVGERLGERVCAGDLILLVGNLGAGKTTFTQGIARGMQIEEVVNSPTFTLLKEYVRPANVTSVSDCAAEGARALYHFDLYRLEEPDEILDLGFDEYFTGSGVSVVEWAERNDGFWPRERLEVHLTSLDETRRKIVLYASGARACAMVQQFQKNKYATTSS
jgi:tRNA threonylcarbamoyladenosine biosynthesis protein TsaE